MRALEIAHFGQDLENQETLYEPFDYLLGWWTQSIIWTNQSSSGFDVWGWAFWDEAKWLFDHYPDVQAAKGIGYKELFPYFRGEQTLDEASESLKQATRRFAKRQLTWFRNRMQVTFYQIGEAGVQDRILSQIEEFLYDWYGKKRGASPAHWSWTPGHGQFWPLYGRIGQSSQDSWCSRSG